MKFAACIVLLVSGLGFGPAGGAAETGFYGGVELGVTEPSVGKSDGIFISIPGIIFRVQPDATRTDGSNSGWGASLGYRINRHLAAELAYTDFGSVDTQETYVIGPFPFLPIDQFVTFTDVHSRVAGPSINLLGILPLGDGFEVFARAGLLFADQDVSRMPGSLSSTVGEELWVVGGGFDVEFARRLSARFAYESVDGLPRTGFAGPIRLERFVFGLSYDF